MTTPSLTTTPQVRYVYRLSPHHRTPDFAGWVPIPPASCHVIQALVWQVLADASVLVGHPEPGLLYLPATKATTT